MPMKLSLLFAFEKCWNKDSKSSDIFLVFSAKQSTQDIILVLKNIKTFKGFF